VTARGGFVGALTRLFRVTPANRTLEADQRHTDTAERSVEDEKVGRGGPAATLEIEPPAPDALRISYSPDRDGDPDAGEIVWT
jgi:hypothetical protein